MSTAIIAAGLRVAAHLGLPLTIAGKPLFISDSIASALGPQQDASLAVADPEAPTIGLAASDAETARQAAWLMRMAEHEINRLGVTVGALPALAPSPPSPSAAPAVLAYAPLPPTRFDIRTQADGSLRINEAFEVRAVGSSWFVARLGDKYELQSWHPTEDAALQWLRAELAAKRSPQSIPNERIDHDHERAGREGGQATVAVPSGRSIGARTEAHAHRSTTALRQGHLLGSFLVLSRS